MSSRQLHSQWRFFAHGAAHRGVRLRDYAPSAIRRRSRRTAQLRHPAQQQVSRDFQKTLSLGSGGSFSIENKFGEVRVHGESSRDVKISATIRVQAGSREEADAYAQKVQIDVLQIGKRDSRPHGLSRRRAPPAPRPQHFVFGELRHRHPVGCAAHRQKQFRQRHCDWRTWPRPDIDNSHGSLSVSQAGPSKLNNSFGSIELHDANGDSFVNDNNGSVDVSGIKGALDLRNRFGSITVRDVKARRRSTAATAK